MHELELEQTNAKWDKKLERMENDMKLLEAALDLKQKSEMEELLRSLEEGEQMAVKHSKEYLELRRCEENLVKQQR